MITLEVLNKFKSIVNDLKNNHLDEVESVIRSYFISSRLENNALYNFLEGQKIPKDIDTLVKLFESLLSDRQIEENGMVFTSRYISDFIVKETLSGISSWNRDITIVDPGCGVGTFLISAAEYLSKRFNIPLDVVFENNIYGFDIDNENIRRCKITLNIFLEKNGYTSINFDKNIICSDSLDVDWKQKLNRNRIDFVIGNPPYVNPHSLTTETIIFLKENFSTTKIGTSNIFYAFIEKAMSELDEFGELGFIVPNNFLSITAASSLRQYLQKNQFVKKIIDLGDNMVFKPIRTYSAIIMLTKRPIKILQYSVISKIEKVSDIFKDINYSELETSKLDYRGWHLVDKITYKNIKKIEGQIYSIDNYIRTGIATLKDNVYFLNKDENGYFKIVDGVRYTFEKELVKSIYKIPELKTVINVSEAKRFILFPYEYDGIGYSLIPEDRMISNYPNSYNYLLTVKEVLATRNKGKGIDGIWYAYGRSQGLNKYGSKLLFPTFSNIPKFMLVDDIDALFCNGYAVFENDIFDLEVLMKILNSEVMRYYISNTSYSIEGGYYCYQKKYIKNFTLPHFDNTELEFIKNASKKELDTFLFNAYNLEK